MVIVVMRAVDRNQCLWLVSWCGDYCQPSQLRIENYQCCVSKSALSRLWCRVSWENTALRMPSTDTARKDRNTRYGLIWYSGYTIMGMMMLPSRPTPVQKARPLERIGVEQDSVVKGYKICSTDFMASRDRAIMTTLSTQTRPRLSRAAAVKKMTMEYLRPSFYLSIMLKVRTMLGSSPMIIWANCVNAPLFFCSKINGMMNSCPQNMKFMANQFTLSRMVVRRAFLEKIYCRLDLFFLSCRFWLQSSLRIFFYYLVMLAFFCYFSSLFRISSLSAISPFSSSTRNDSGILTKIITDSARLTKQRTDYGFLQLCIPKQQADRIAKNLPAMAIKLMNSNDLPRYFCGIISESRVLAMMSVAPKPSPAIINDMTKMLNLLQQTMIKLAMVWITCPKNRVDFLPEKLARDPARRDPAMMPKQKARGMFLTSSSRPHSSFRCGEMRETTLTSLYS